MEKTILENKKNQKYKWLIIFISLIIALGGSWVIILKVNKYKAAIQQHSQVDKTQDQKKELWTCTMHPQVISEKPNQCPICDMDLAKKITYNNHNENEIDTSIRLSGNKIVIANISTIRIEKTEIKKQINVYSYMDIADQNRKVISARFNGRIERLFIDKTGDRISKEQALFDVYSPDLVQAQNEFLIALNSSQNMSSLIISAKKKLQIYGLTENQIDELANKKEIKMIITFYSTISGTIIDKKIQEGMYINEGMPLFEVADLTSLWNIGEINESELNIIKIGSKVNLILQAYPGEVFEGKVSFIYPVVNAQTRTVKIRSDFTNSKDKLKPQMYGQASFERNFGEGLLVPAESILFMGKRNVVWLKVEEGMFEPREVIVGMKIRDKYQILSGINVGDEVAITGGFLLDSESQLKSGMTSGHQHDENTQTKSLDKEYNIPQNSMENVKHQKQ